RRMVTEFGMSDKLGPIQFGTPQGQVFLGRDFHSERNYSDKIAYEIDSEIQEIMKSSYERARVVLTENRDKLDLIARTLLEIETLDAKQIESLMKTGELPPPIVVEEEETVVAPKLTAQAEEKKQEEVANNVATDKEDEKKADE
ncbi:MAG: ATP-dependent zinc metalloprotease FtsH, partial [Bacilli bacterium]